MELYFAVVIPAKPCVLIVDDHPLIRDALRDTLLKGELEMTVKTADSLEAALELLGGLAPIDLVLLDLTLPGHHGLSALWTLRERFPAQPVAIFSADADPQTIQSALTSGARGYLPKRTSPPAIQQALRLILAGETYVPVDALFGTVAPREPSVTDATPNPLALPTRQREIVELVAKGLSNKEICRRLDLSPNTVKTHLATIFETLGVRSRYEIFALVHKATSGTSTTPKISPGALAEASSRMPS